MASSRTVIRYLSREDVERLGLRGTALAAAIEGTLQAASRGAAKNFPKTSSIRPDGRLFQSIMAVGFEAPAPVMAATKIVGLSPANHERGLPHIGGLIVLNDGETGMPVAVMDATWITEARTAALSLVAARRYARPDARRIGFIGCGAQARAHLAVFSEVFPLASVTAYSRGRPSVEVLAERARGMGLEAEIADAPHDAVHGQDIVISSVPDSPGLTPFLSAEWLSPGSFASLVDLGRSWQPEGFETFEHRLVDDRAQAEASRHFRKLTPDGPYNADLIEMAVDPSLLRQSERARAVLTFQGMALADLAAAALAMERAAGTGIGTLLPA